MRRFNKSSGSRLCDYALRLAGSPLMATGWDDFTTSGNWTQDRDATNTTWTITGGTVNTGGGNGVEGLSLNAVDSDANRDNAEIYGRFYVTSALTSTPQFVAFVRGTTGGSGPYRYAFRVGGGFVRTYKLVNSTSYVQISTVTTTNFDGVGSYEFRFRVNGTTVEGRVWKNGTTEPSTWNSNTSDNAGVTGTDSAVTGTGWMGLQASNSATGNKYWLGGIGWGTNGDTAPSAGGHTVALNQVSETDTPQVFTHAKQLAFGQNSETDTVQAINRAKAVALGQTAETDTPQAFNRAKQLTLGQPEETDVAQSIQASGSKIIPVGQVAESDAAQAFASQKAKAFAQTSESDSTAALTAGRVYALGETTEADEAQAFAKTKRADLNQAAETDAAQPIQAAGTKIIALGQVTETEFAQALAHFKALGILQAAETDEVFALTAAKAITIGQAHETDTALNFGGHGIPPYEVLATAYQPRTRRAEYQPRTLRIPR